MIIEGMGPGTRLQLQKLQISIKSCTMAQEPREIMGDINAYIYIFTYLQKEECLNSYIKICQRKNLTHLIKGIEMHTYKVMHKINFKHIVETNKTKCENTLQKFNFVCNRNARRGGEKKRLNRLQHDLLYKLTFQGKGIFKNKYMVKFVKKY